MKKLLAFPIVLGLAVMAGLRAPTAQPIADVGSPLPVVELEGFAQTGAESFDVFAGRLVLIEFFAYW